MRKMKKKFLSFEQAYLNVLAKNNYGSAQDDAAENLTVITFKTADPTIIDIFNSGFKTATFEVNTKGDEKTAPVTVDGIQFNDIEVIMPEGSAAECDEQDDAAECDEQDDAAECDEQDDAAECDEQDEQDDAAECDEQDDAAECDEQDDAAECDEQDDWAQFMHEQDDPDDEECDEQDDPDAEECDCANGKCKGIYKESVRHPFKNRHAMYKITRR